MNPQPLLAAHGAAIPGSAALGSGRGGRTPVPTTSTLPAGNPTDLPLRATGPDSAVGGVPTPRDGGLADDPVPGAASPVTGVARPGDRPVAGLRPHLGAYGHLVALCEGDPAHLHVHPTVGHGPDVGRAAAAPSAGRHRLFQFTLTTAGREGRTDGHGH